MYNFREFVLFQAEDGIRYLVRSRGLGDVYKRQMMDIVKKYDDQPVTEIHIVGGVMPQYDVKFYSTLSLIHI